MEFSLFSVVSGKILNLGLILLVVFIFSSKGLKSSVDSDIDYSIILIFIAALF